MRLGRGIREPIVYLDEVYMSLTKALEYRTAAIVRGFKGSGESLIKKAILMEMENILYLYINDKLSHIINKGKTKLDYRIGN